LGEKTSEVRFEHRSPTEAMNILSLMNHLMFSTQDRNLYSSLT